MNDEWKKMFDNRMRDFASSRAPHPGEYPVSLKIRASSGCFHREHSPNAYRFIDEYLLSTDNQLRDFKFEEHESGPEILVYLAVTAAGVSLANSVIDLITTIIKARSEGITNGDRKHDPLELIIRRTRRNGDVDERKVIVFRATDPVMREEIAKMLERVASKLLSDESLRES